MTATKRLKLAEALLAKAQASGFESERDAFVAGAYDQLAAYMGGGQSGDARQMGSAWRATAVYRRTSGPGLLVDLAL